MGSQVIMMKQVLALTLLCMGLHEAVGSDSEKDSLSPAELHEAAINPADGNSILLAPLQRQVREPKRKNETGRKNSRKPKKGKKGKKGKKTKKGRKGKKNKGRKGRKGGRGKKGKKGKKSLKAKKTRIVKNPESSIQGRDSTSLAANVRRFYKLL